MEKWLRNRSHSGNRFNLFNLCRDTFVGDKLSWNSKTKTQCTKLAHAFMNHTILHWSFCYAVCTNSLYLIKWYHVLMIRIIFSQFQKSDCKNNLGRNEIFMAQAISASSILAWPCNCNFCFKMVTEWFQTMKVFSGEKLLNAVISILRSMSETELKNTFKHWVHYCDQVANRDSQFKIVNVIKNG
jgi:hypothetical protein